MCLKMDKIMIMLLIKRLISNHIKIDTEPGQILNILDGLDLASPVTINTYHI